MDKQSKQILMLAYYFPPLGGAGVQRSAKFAKYLARLGWQVHVVSVVPPPFEPVDPSLERDIQHKQITVESVQYLPRFRNFDRIPGGWRVRSLLDGWFSFPDRMRGWLRPALNMASKICSENPGIIIFSTSAPYTAHLIALELKRRYGVPWVADFRDEWSQNPYLSTVTPYHFYCHKKAEQAVLHEADTVISVTDKITQGLRKIAPDSKASFYTIPNGFDPEDFSFIHALGSSQVDDKRWTLTHVGTVNRARAELLVPLIRTLKQLDLRGVIPLSSVKMQLIGAGDWENTEFSGLDWVETHSYLPHKEALKAMAQSDLVILAESNPSAFTGKIFEYLGLHKTILGLVHPQSPAADLIKEAEAGFVIGCEGGSGLEEALIKAFQSWQRVGRLTAPKPEVIARFNREHQAETLAQILEQIRGKTEE
jgi:glycosyltransferase involved in cell wall biosynthesis